MSLALEIYPFGFWIEQKLNGKRAITDFWRCQEMNVNKGLRFLAAVLSFLSGILHLVGGLFLSGLDVVTLAVGVGFGVALMIIGVGLFMGKRVFYYAGIIVPLIGGISGTYTYVTTQVMTLPFVVIDVVVILCCAYLVLRKEPQSTSA
jgi:hypothetical protein